MSRSGLPETLSGLKLGAGKMQNSGIFDRNKIEIKVGDILVEEAGLVRGTVRYEKGAFRVRLKYYGNKKNGDGWGLRTYGCSLGDYYVYDRVKRYRAVVSG